MLRPKSAQRRIASLADETFTDFMIGCMQGEDAVSSAFVIVRRSDGTVGYRAYRQDVSDTLGLLRYVGLSVESDLVRGWQE